MTAETLRAAASLMRERAERATPGPWRVAAEGSEGSRIAPDCEDKRQRTRFIGILNGRVQPEDGHNAAHVASWDPLVAFAVADLLDDGAFYVEFVQREHPGEPIDQHARFYLALARTYLGEDTP